MSDKVENGNGPIAKPPRTRSPNYPAINLEVAVRKLPNAFQQMKRHAVGVESAVKALGLSYSSSSGKLALAAMRAFGLFDDAEKGMVKLSKRALDLIDYKEGDKEWRDAVIAAATTPNMHKKLLDRYDTDLPADEELRRYLIREEGFNDNTVGQFIDEFKKTIEFSGLAGGTDTEKNGDGQRPPEVKVGDYVQWTSAGMDQFPAPRRVLEIVGDGEWALIEDSDTGIPMSELTVQESPAAALPTGKTPPPNPHYKPPTPKGPAISFPLPNDNVIEIRLAKPISKKDFDRIVKLIELSEDSLVASE